MTGTETRHCRRCRSVFFVRADEARWFAARGWPVPTNCPTFRREKRLRRETAAGAAEGGANHEDGIR